MMFLGRKAVVESIETNIISSKIVKFIVYLAIQPSLLVNLHCATRMTHHHHCVTWSTTLQTTSTTAGPARPSAAAALLLLLVATY